MKAVVLIGGGGKRLWPLSTPEKPKQFHALVSDKTLIEETIERLDFLSNEDIYLALNKENIVFVKDLCPQIPEKNLIIEPALRDTSSCIGFAAAVIEKKHPGEVMAIIYADHIIQNKKEFQEKLIIAEKIAKEEGTLNVIEVPAKEPNINYGYAKKGKLVKEIEGTKIYELDSFKEKPDLKAAEHFVKSGDYFWNTGIYVWKASTLLNHYQNLQPETSQKFQEMMKFLGTDQEEQIIRETYPTLEKISIDYAIMEKVNPAEVRLIEAELGWSDIGNWQAIWEMRDKDNQGNAENGDTKLLNCKNCLVHSETDKKISVIGVENLIIINTKDGLLVCNQEDSKRVKEIKTS